MSHWNSSRDWTHLDRWLKRMSRRTLNGHTRSLKYTVRSGSEQRPHGSSARSGLDGGRSSTGMSRDNRWPRLPESQPHGEPPHGATAPKATPTLLARHRTVSGTNPCRQASEVVKRPASALLEVPAQRHCTRRCRPDVPRLLQLALPAPECIAGPGHPVRSVGPDRTPTADASGCTHEPSRQEARALGKGRVGTQDPVR